METDTQEGQEFTDAMRMPVLKIVRRGNATSIVFTLPGYARLLILAITAKLLGVDLAAVGRLATTLLNHHTLLTVTKSLDILRAIW